jgi:thiamine-monophosphate kinase
MPGEREIIEIMNNLLPQGRLNRSHESDCEIIALDDKQYLFTTDEFSAEDRLVESDPRLLGWNVAAGALSDVYACGGRPLYYAHALTVAKIWDSAFVTGFGRGVTDALRQSGAKSIGGDCGQAAEWRCCVTVIGACEGRPLSRMGAKPGDGMYITGRIGAGNAQAALGLVSLPTFFRLPVSITGFHLRKRESALLRSYASSCIDTSDGLWKAVSIIADLNGCGYALDTLPFIRTGTLLAKAAGMQRILLFFGECGEYELLCTVPSDRESAFLRDARSEGLEFFRIGSVTENCRTVVEKGRTLNLGALRIEARDFSHARDYLAALTEWLQRQEDGNGK